MKVIINERTGTVQVFGTGTTNVLDVETHHKKWYEFWKDSITVELNDFDFENVDGKMMVKSGTWSGLNTTT